MENLKRNENLLKRLSGDFFGGLAAALVALPAAIAFGLIIYSPLGEGLASRGAIAGIIGTIVLSIIAAILGGTKRLITAPCAPAAAVMAVLVKDLLEKGMPASGIPGFLLLVVLLAGLFQVLIGFIGAGRFIKYIPYPVVAGYLSGVGVLILIGQLPNFLGLSRGTSLIEGLLQVSTWRWEAILVGLMTMLAMYYGDKLTKKIPATMLALTAGIGTYFIVSLFVPALRLLEGNTFLLGPIAGNDFSYFSLLKEQCESITSLGWATLTHLFVPALTLAVLLSMDTLKTCVVLDALTRNRHNSNKEMMGQGLGNMGSALLGGMPGAGTMGATLVSLSSGAETRFAGIFMGISAFCIFLFLNSLIAWIPLAALSGVLLLVAIRMIDKKSFKLLHSRQTILDFVVILAVVIAAVTLSLISAAGVGIAMAILLFLRDHIKRSVVRRQIWGDAIFSKKKRVGAEREVLESKGKETVVFELQGQLFFGTTDQLFTEVAPYIGKCTNLIFDMKRVQTMDYTAANLLHQIEMQLKEQSAQLFFVDVPDSLVSGLNIRAYMQELGFDEKKGESLFFQNLDSALEFCEEKILDREMPLRSFTQRELNLEEIEFFAEIKLASLKILETKMKIKKLGAEEFVFKQSDPGNEIFFIRRGEVKIVLPLASGHSHHLATFTQGDFFGDMSFLDRKKRSANALATSETILYYFSRDDFEELSREFPEIGTVVYERLAYMLALRLRRTNREVTALQEA